MLRKIKTKLKSFKGRPLSALLFLLVVAAAFITVLSVLIIVIYIFVKGVPFFKPSLFAPVYNSENVSLFPAVVNTLAVAALALVIAAPIGIFAAVYLVEYTKRTTGFVRIVRMAAETLAGIPSIVYGLFGLLFFVRFLHWGYSLLAGALTLAIMILPLIMRTAEESLRAVPDSYREGCYALGAGKLRAVFKVVLPAAVPGIVSGIVLSLGRVAGETAALIFTAGSVAQIPPSLLGSGRTLAVHLYVLASEGMHTGEAYATAVVLIVLVALLNGISYLAAGRLNKRTK